MFLFGFMEKKVNFGLLVFGYDIIRVSKITKVVTETEVFLIERESQLLTKRECEMFNSICIKITKDKNGISNSHQSDILHSMIFIDIQMPYQINTTWTWFIS